MSRIVRTLKGPGGVAAALHYAKVRLARLLCHRWIGAVLGSLLRDRIRSRGCVIECGYPSIRASTKASLFFGFYESSEIRFVRKYLRPDSDVIELGASLGVVSAHIGRRLEPGRRLICVEANSALLPAVRRNVELNSQGVDLRLVHGAVDYASECDQVTFVEASRSTDSRVVSDGDGREGVPVRRVTLGSLVEECRMRDYVLVCDVEGAEAGLILAEETALDRCQMIIAELHASSFRGTSVGVDDLVKALEARGFVALERHGPVGVFAPRGTC